MTTLVDQWEASRAKAPRRIFPLAVPMLLVVAGGAEAAMTSIAAHPRLRSREVARLNAHATSTPSGNLAESKAIRTASVGADHPPISATKSPTGCLLGAAGAWEPCYRHGGERRVAPAQINLDEPDPGIDRDLVASGPRTPSSTGHLGRE
ncbi:MAG TPA: hypothetical protein VES01_04300 [Dermatophilaceae bacterium]|nr:hypothetical protein [Dermatophilaceae bacterium]